LDVIYAGIDTNGVDHNQQAWTVPCGGSGLVWTPQGTLRTAALRGGVAIPGAHNAYSRIILRDPLTVPYTVSGEILLRSRLDSVVILGENRTPTWNWGAMFHPVFVDEDNNVVTGFAPGSTNWSASGQLDGKYGIARASRYTPPFDHDAQLGAWHRFRMEVPAVGHHRVFWDDVLVYDVVEKSPPAAWWTRPLRAGLRLDFYDFELRNLSPEAAMTLYPDGYGRAEVTLEQMVAKHGAKMHPEYRRRLMAWLVSRGGRMGIGGGWRSTQPDKPGFAPDGKSFHQDQRFASGFVGYAAVDLVVRNPGQVHRSPTWAECADAPEWGLHTFIKSPPEPWHMQCIEMRGWQSWVDAGRRDPGHFPLPGEPVPPPPPKPTGDVDMLAIDHKPGTPLWTALTWTGTHLSWVADGHADAVIRRAGVQRITVNDVEVDGIIRSSTTTTACPSPWVNTARGAAWSAQRG
jgi:hypothetical protein